MDEVMRCSGFERYCRVRDQLRYTQQVTLGGIVTYSLQDTDGLLNVNLSGSSELDESVRDVLCSDSKVSLELLGRYKSVVQRLLSVGGCLFPASKNQPGPLYRRLTSNMIWVNLQVDRGFWQGN
jgi:hypothetical protein